jgi:hypothetical protein
VALLPCLPQLPALMAWLEQVLGVMASALLAQRPTAELLHLGLWAASPVVQGAPQGLLTGGVRGPPSWETSSWWLPGCGAGSLQRIHDPPRSSP